MTSAEANSARQTTEETNRALIRRMFRAIDRGEFQALEQVFHPAIVYERGGYAPFTGLEAVMKFYRTERVLASGEHRLESIVVEGNQGACWGRFVGKKKSGEDVDLLFSDVYRFESGRVIFRRSHFYIGLV